MLPLCSDDQDDAPIVRGGAIRATSAVRRHRVIDQRNRRRAAREPCALLAVTASQLVQAAPDARRTGVDLEDGPLHLLTAHL